MYCFGMGTVEESYTHGHHPVIVAAHARRTAAEAAGFVLPRISAGMRVLDVGCGPGSITVGLADHVGPTGHVVGVDNSREAIAIAASTRGHRPHLDYQVASVYELPFAAASFDVGYGHQTLQHLGDPVAALVEIRRVLRPGALLAVRDSDYGTMTHFPRYAELDAWLELYHAVARANGGEPDAGRRLSAWVRRAGFSEITVSSSVWTYATPDERAEWASLWANRIVLPRFRDRAAELGLAEAEGIAAMAEAWMHWAQEPDGWFGFIHGEVVATRFDD